MLFDLSTRRRLRIQSFLFLLLFITVIGLLAWLSHHYTVQFDWTASGRNTLSKTSQTLLARIHGTVQITAYTHENPALRAAISRLIDRYRRYKPDIKLHFVNPDALPQQVRELGITAEGELYLEYQGRGKRVRQLNEQALSQALQQLSRQKNRTVRFLEGHGERQLLGIANHDLGTFGKELLKTGVRLQAINLSYQPVIPIETDVFIIADPQEPLSSNETRAILDYIDQGGNLLWLLEPNDKSGLRPLTMMLGIRILPGMIIDPDTAALNIDHPAFIPVVDYSPHPITRSLQALALFPQAAALDFQPDGKWMRTILLETQAETWTETGTPDQSAQFEPNHAEHHGPLILGAVLTRSDPDKPPKPQQQRIVVIGDGDFLSNTYLGNGANLELGLNILNWLTMDEVLIDIPSRIVTDSYLDLSEQLLAFLAALFLFGLPGILLVSGGFIWFYRKQR